MSKTLAPGRAGIAQLARDLRAISQVSDFIWDFSNVIFRAKDNPERFEEQYHRPCGTAGCAMGFAMILYNNINDLSIHLGLDKEFDEPDIEENLCPGEQLFFLSEKYYPNQTYETVTPEMVADALEKYLEETSDDE